MQADIPYHLENFIGGYFIGPLSSRFIDNNVNPATGQVYGQVPDSNEKMWIWLYGSGESVSGLVGHPGRKKICHPRNRIAELIDHHLPQLALAETNDNGKPLWLSTEVDIPRASSNFSLFATGIMHFASESHAMEDRAINYTLRQPIGIVGCISPLESSPTCSPGKSPPMLAAGNCVVAKPPRSPR